MRTCRSSSACRTRCASTRCRESSAGAPRSSSSAATLASKLLARHVGLVRCEAAQHRAPDLDLRRARFERLSLEVTLGGRVGWRWSVRGVSHTTSKTPVTFGATAHACPARRPLRVRPQRPPRKAWGSRAIVATAGSPSKCTASNAVSNTACGCGEPIRSPHATRFVSRLPPRSPCSAAHRDRIRRGARRSSRAPCPRRPPGGVRVRGCSLPDR